MWLWLEHGERPERREAVLARAAELLPGEASGLRRIAELRERSADSTRAPLEDTLRAIVVLSAAVAETIGRETADAALTDVQLDGAADPLILPKGGLGAHPLLPLCDWPALACGPTCPIRPARFSPGLRATRSRWGRRGAPRGPRRVPGAPQRLARS